MVRTSPRITDLGQNVSLVSDPVVFLPKISFSSTIYNRSQVTNFASDLLPKFGVDRYQIQQIVTVDSETGASGELVYRVANDKHDAVRFVGKWSNSGGTAGPHITTNGTWTSPNDYIEIVFYGTGLNLLLHPRQAVISADVEIDNGSATTVPLFTSTSSTMLVGRNYAGNCLVPVASGLTQGLHFARIKGRVGNGDDFRIYGYEIVNNTAQIKSVPGTAIISGDALSLTSDSLFSYNSGFESGSLGTKGGRVVVYLKEDNTIGKAVTPADSSQTTLASVTHANEEVIRTFYWREFGAGRSDDMSSAPPGTGGAKAFTLDDNTTTLVMNASGVSGSLDAWRPVNNNEYMTLTFVGTGLDIERVDDGTSTTDTITVIVDNTTIGTLSTSGSTSRRIERIISGLAYETHTVKFIRTATGAGSTPHIPRFITYGPKKPTIPSTAVELCEYYIVGNFSAPSPSTNTAIPHEVGSRGVIRKTANREMQYTGTGWGFGSADATSDGLTGFRANTTSTGNYVEYTFWGTGFDFRYSQYSNNATNVTVSVNGSTNLSGFTTVSYGGTSFTPATGVLNQNLSSGVGTGGLAVTGLTLGWHTIRVTYTSGGTAMRFSAFDIVTPIHVPKINTPFVLNNTLAVGSQGIGDLRNFGKQIKMSSKHRGQCILMTNASTTLPFSAPNVPTSLGQAFYVSKDCEVRLSSSVSITHSNSQAMYTRFYLNGQPIGSPMRIDPQDTTVKSMSNQAVVHLSKGWHYAQLMYGTGGAGTLLIYEPSSGREGAVVTVEELQ